MRTMNAEQSGKCEWAERQGIIEEPFVNLGREVVSSDRPLVFSMLRSVSMLNNDKPQGRNG